MDGDIRAIGRVLSAIEDRTLEGRRLYSELFRSAGAAWSVGVTGAPGCGKSSLVSGLVDEFVDESRRVAVVAVDPSSPFGGGAILGDRIRMADHAADPRVFIRSVANRGALGGISASTPAVVSALDGLGFEQIVIETVGVGQSEVDIARTADTTVVVVNPGWGDSVQVAKAGFLEVADVFVVNKADRPGAESAASDLAAMVADAQGDGWRPPIVSTVAIDGRGMSELAAAIRTHREHVASLPIEDRLRPRAAHELGVAIGFESERRRSAGSAGAIVDAIVHREVDPWTAAERVLSSE